MDRRGFLLSALVLAGCQSRSAGISGRRADERDLASALHAYFDPLAASRDLSGVIRVERGAAVTDVSFGYADWGGRTPIGPDTRFAAGSIGKSLVETTALLLAARGRLDLDEPVSAYLPDYRYGGGMTVDQVMRNVAGLPRDVPEAERAAFGEAGLIGWLNARPPAPTGSPMYSNVGYELLAAIVSHAGGRPFERLAQDLILDPLRMTGSLFDASSINRFAARPHEPGPPPVEVRAAEGEHLTAAGNLFATAADLARWGRAVRDGEIVGLRRSDGTMAGSVAEREVGGRPAIWMQGSVTGGGAVVAAFPDEDVVIVCAVNLASYPQFNSENIVAKIVFGDDPGAVLTRLPTAPLADAHRALAGRYVVPGLGDVRIHEADGEMRLTVTGAGWTYYLTPASEGRLVLRKLNYAFSAIRDENGAVTGLDARLHMLGEAPGEARIERLAD